jgi:hypothetical protein
MSLYEMLNDRKLETAFQRESRTHPCGVGPASGCSFFWVGVWGRARGVAFVVGVGTEATMTEVFLAAPTAVLPVALATPAGALRAAAPVVVVALESLVAGALVTRRLLAAPLALAAPVSVHDAPVDDFAVNGGLFSPPIVALFDFSSLGTLNAGRDRGVEAAAEPASGLVPAPVLGAPIVLCTSRSVIAACPR